MGVWAREREGKQRHNAGDSSRTPQTLSHLFCSCRFVGFLPLDSKTTVVGRCGVSVSSRAEIAQMETSVSFSLRPPVTRSSHSLSLLSSLALFLYLYAYLRVSFPQFLRVLRAQKLICYNLCACVYIHI